MFFKNDFLENFANFIVKHVPESLFYSAWNFLGKGTPAQLFSYEFCEIFKNNFFTEHFGTTASEYGNNMPRAFRTKCEKKYTILWLLISTFICDCILTPKFIKQQQHEYSKIKQRIKQSHINSHQITKRRS